MQKNRREVLRDAGIVSVILGGLAAWLPWKTKATEPAASTYWIQIKSLTGHSREWSTISCLFDDLDAAKEKFAFYSLHFAGTTAARLIKVEIAEVIEEIP